MNAWTDSADIVSMKGSQFHKDRDEQARCEFNRVVSMNALTVLRLSRYYFKVSEPISEESRRAGPLQIQNLCLYEVVPISEGSRRAGPVRIPCL